jgi:rhodanese-related sulfurtransferase
MDTVSLDPCTLHSLAGTDRCPMILDVRREPAYRADGYLIRGALRPAGDIAAFAAQHAAGRRVVTYCVHGHEVSQDAARRLREAGLDAAYLEGGIEAWRAAGLPTVRRDPEGGCDSQPRNPSP